MFSIYVSAFNIENNLFNWRDSLNLYSKWAKEVVIASTTNSSDNSIDILKEYCSSYSNIKLVITDFSLQDPEFDGKIKNAALQATTQPAKILLDLDEFIPLSQKQIWIDTYKMMEEYKADGVLIPSINLCKDIYHYKDIGYKFYLHKANLFRGVWKEARNKDGSINIERSDTTELIREDGSLARCIQLPNKLQLLQSGHIPYVFHKWAIDIDTRIKQNNFWKPVWQGRAKREVNDIILNKEEIENIEVFKHNLLLE